MKIAVDAMGGDHAPEATLEGTLLAWPQCSAELILIGDEAQLRKILGDSDGASSIRVVHASQTIGMGEAGPMAIRKKRDASLSVAMRLLAEEKVDAVVSAGNTSAIVATAKHFVGLMPGLRRPALAVPIPTLFGKVLLVDAGAHAEANTVHLAQSAALAHVYLKVTENLSQPRVGLLNLGQEPMKGTKIIQRAFAILERSHLQFAGNIEPSDLFTDRIDAAICDGFLGNVLLKMYEGLAETLPLLLEAQLDKEEAHLMTGLQQVFRRFRKAHHYQNVGGAPLLGVTKPVIVAHGRSQGTAIANAIHLAFRLGQENIPQRMADELEKNSVLADLKHTSALLMLENLKKQWGFTPR